MQHWRNGDDMRAAQLTSPKTLEIIETEVPIPNEDEILVKLDESPAGIEPCIAG